MIGALAVRCYLHNIAVGGTKQPHQNSRESTPNTISAAQSPTGTNDNHLQPSRLGSNAPTLAGSVVAGVDSPPVGPLARMGIVFRADHTMVTTFDKKTDGELYDLWTA